MMKHPTCIFVCGSTGVGKSEISIHLASRLQGEIINADAFQLYSGLDIATAKVSESEMDGIPHHLLGSFPPSETLNVHKFKEHALPIVSDIFSRCKTPVVVGGTHYYVESLLFTKTLVDESFTKEGHSDPDMPSDKSYSDVYAALKSVDPEAAAVIHPNDTRRIHRALEIIQQTGGPLSAVFRDQQAQGGASPRFPAVVVIVDYPWEELKERLRRRVDGMVTAGLIKEVTAMHTELSRQKLSPCSSVPDANDDYMGLSAAIGYKELLPYIEAVAGDESDEQLSRIFTDCIEQIKSNTIKYAKKQQTWIKNSLIPKCKRSGVQVLRIWRGDTTLPHLYESDEGDVVRFTEIEALVEAIESRDVLPPSQTQNIYHSDKEPSFPGSCSDSTRMWRKRNIFECDVCGNRVLQGHDQYEEHIKSKRHRKRVTAMHKRQKNMLSMSEKKDSGS